MNAMTLLRLLLFSLLISSCGHKGWIKYGQKRGWVDTLQVTTQAAPVNIPTLGPKLQEVKLDLITEIGAVALPCQDQLSELQKKRLDSIITRYVPKIVQAVVADSLTFVSPDGRVKFTLFPGPVDQLSGSFTYQQVQVKPPAPGWRKYWPWFFGVFLLGIIVGFLIRSK